MKYFVCLFSLSFLFLYSELYSQEFNYDIHGNVRQWTGLFVHSPSELAISETKVKFELTSTNGEYAAFRVLSYYTYDALTRSGVLELKEGYLDYYSSLVDIRFGKQIITWGKADELNPTDVLCPQNMGNILEDKAIRKIGLVFFKTDWNLDFITLTAIWKPEFNYFRLPPLKSRWSFFSIPGVLSLPEPLYPDRELKNTEWAFKLSKTIERFDFTISWFDGWDNIFTPEVAINPVTQELQVNNLVFYRTRMIGADFASVAGSFGFWGEGGFFFTEDNEGTDPNIKNPYAQFVIGADYDFGSNVRLNVQYYQEIITKIDNNAEETSEESIISKLGLNLPIQQAISCRIEKKFGEGDAHRVELLTLYDPKHTGIMLISKLAYSPEDAFVVEIGGALFSGKSPSLFGRFNRNDELYLKGTFSF
jgi:hypothetical protein